MPASSSDGAKKPPGGKKKASSSSKPPPAPRKKPAPKKKPVSRKRAAAAKEPAGPGKAAPAKKAAARSKPAPKKKPAAEKSGRRTDSAEVPPKARGAQPPADDLDHLDDLEEPADFPDDREDLDEEALEAEVDLPDSSETVGAGQVQDAVVAAPPRRRRSLPSMPPRRADGTVTIGYSPDADDAFMFYGLVTGKVETEGRRYELVREEIQSLNEKAQEGIYDVTAISFAAYPHLAERYLLLTCGASFGDGQGPVMVARTAIRTTEVNGLTVAVPGMLTTATLALRLWLPRAKLNLVEVPFDEVVPTVRSGRTRAGVLIHEAQLTYRELGLVPVVDFGRWWGERTEGLPLPLGANAIRRDIPEDEREKIALDVKRSIAYGLGHREEALDYAMGFAKGLDRRLVDRYVGLYVNELALDYAERGRQAVQLFFEEAKRFGFLPKDAEPEFA